MTKETIDVLTTKFQPMYTRHFVLDISGIDSFLVDSFQIQPLTPSSKKGKFHVVLYTSITPSTYCQIYELMKPSWKDKIVRWIHNDSKAVLKLLDPVGTVVNKHVMHGLKLESVDFGVYTYDTKVEEPLKKYNTICSYNTDRKVAGIGELKKVVFEFSFKKYEMEY